VTLTDDRVADGMDSLRALEPRGSDLRDLLAMVSSYVCSTVDDISNAPASQYRDVAEVLRDAKLRGDPPLAGRPLDDVLHDVGRAASIGVNPASPGCLAYVPGSGLVSAAVADLLIGVLNRYVGQAFAAPGLVALECDVLRWMADLFALPARAMGLLTSGASIATFSALVTARTAKLGDDFLSGTLYVTGQTHHAIAKAARLAGFPAAAVRIVPVDRRLHMDVASLRSMIRQDRDAGKRPFCVVATAGTTNTGAIDPLAAISDVAVGEKLWLHVDAAYGGFFILTDRGRALLSGIDRADSLVLDPHKSLFLPFGTGALLVRDGELLRHAHSVDQPAYLQDGGDYGLPNFGDYGPELTRDARGLRLWLPLQLHGVEAFRSALNEKLDLARLAYDELRADPHLEVLGPPELSIVAYRMKGNDAARADSAMAEVLRRVNAEQHVFLSSTQIDGRYVGRLSVLNHRTDRSRVLEATGALRRHAAMVVQELP
jgi:aromatic-L-amino-acid/L-tryptophan decarboxylase